MYQGVVLWYSRWLIVQKNLNLRISQNIYCGYVYCTLKGAGPDKSNIRRDGIGMGMFGQNMKIVFVGQK